jgi:hypothetical protein
MPKVHPKNYLLILSAIVFLVVAGAAVYIDASNGGGSFINTLFSPTKTQTTLDKAVDKIDLTISSPEDGAVVKTGKLTITGKTVPGAEVFCNDVEAIANINGGFSLKVDLEEGENTLIILANSPTGEFTQKEITVNLVSFE